MFFLWHNYRTFYPHEKAMRALFALFVPIMLAACTGSDETDANAASGMEAAGERVTIITPMPGVQTGTTVTVTLSSTVPILPAGDLTEGTGHHHLYLDADLTDAGVPVPTVPGSIVHMGDASTSYVFEGVSPGEHRIIAVIADGVHVPLQPWVVDTVSFTVN
jgi:hypothetical protein